MRGCYEAAKFQALQPPAVRAPQKPNAVKATAAEMKDETPTKLPPHHAQAEVCPCEGGHSWLANTGGGTGGPPAAYGLLGVLVGGKDFFKQNIIGGGEGGVPGEYYYLP